MGEAVGLRREIALPRQRVAAQGHNVAHAQEVQVEQFALNLRA